MDKLTPTDFVPFNIFEEAGYPICVNLVYAQSNHPDNQFKGLYHESARLLWAHKDIVPVVLLASLICRGSFGWNLQINDCLRPTEAQEKMLKYGYDPSLVSLPGEGAHPRGMAVDVEPIGMNGQWINMGTPFDHFAQELNDNPAARHYMHFQKSAGEIVGVRTRRGVLETAFQLSAESFGLDILPLPEEWWDFRFERPVWSKFEPVREALLPSYMHVVGAPTSVPNAVQEEWSVLVRETNRQMLRQTRKIKLDPGAPTFCG